MRPRFRIGLIVGGVSLVLVFCPLVGVGTDAFVAFVAMVVAAVAGFFAADKENLGTRSEGATPGAVAGAIAGGMFLVCRFALLSLILAAINAAGTVYPPGSYPEPRIGPGDIILAALAGGAAGYLRTPRREP